MSLDLRPLSLSSLLRVVLSRPFHAPHGDQTGASSTSRRVNQFSCIVKAFLSRLRYGAESTSLPCRLRTDGKALLNIP